MAFEGGDTPSKQLLQSVSNLKLLNRRHLSAQVHVHFSSSQASPATAIACALSKRATTQHIPNCKAVASKPLRAIGAKPGLLFSAAGMHS
eukprot:17421-Heterococcus_DN1.PRE.2